LVYYARQPVKQVSRWFRWLVCYARQPVEQVSPWLVCYARQPVEQVSWRFRWMVCCARQPAEPGPLGAESGVGHRDLCLIMMIAREPDILPSPAVQVTHKTFQRCISKLFSVYDVLIFLQKISVIHSSVIFQVDYRFSFLLCSQSSLFGIFVR